MILKLKLLPLLAGAWLLSGCGMASMLLGGMAAPQPAPQIVQTASAPLARTTVDESGYRTALAGTRTIVAGVNLAIARGWLVKNTPPALAVRQGLIALRSGLKAARSALDALNDPATSTADLPRKLAEYRQAMADAEQASEDVAEAIAAATAARK
jgi:hypothetical protein